MDKRNILVIEDEEEMLGLIRYNLNKEGFATNCFASGKEALKMIKTQKPDLILLDIMLPDISGLEICKTIKNDSNIWNIPVILLTARNSDFDIETGFSFGADDYITKPFSEKILIARINAALRREERKNEEKNSILKIQDMLIDPNKHEVWIKGKFVELTYSEFQILHLLVLHQGRVFTRDKIIDEIRGDDCLANSRSIDVLIVRLRKKLGQYGKYIETIYGIGYRFKES